MKEYTILYFCLFLVGSLKSLDSRQEIDSPEHNIKREEHNSFCFNQQVIHKDHSRTLLVVQPRRQQKVIMGNSLLSLFLFTFLLVGSVQCNPNYADALAKSLLFFQGQRSGRVPADQQLKWRSNSGLFDGRLANVTISFFLSFCLFYFVFACSAQSIITPLILILSFFIVVIITKLVYLWAIF